MTETGQQKPARLRPWLRIVFGASLALNLAVVGLAAGAYFRFDKHDAGRRTMPIGAVLYRELPREEQRALRKAAMGDRHAHSERRRAEAEALADALRAVPFQASRVEALLEAHGQAMETFQSDVRAAWLDRVEQMSDAERAAYADRLQQAMLSRKKPKPDRD